MKKRLIILILIAGLSAGLKAGEAGGNGMAFLKLDVDARAAGMGGAFTALASDAGASFWNPAGLAAAEGSSMIVMHNQWLLDITQQFAAINFKKGRHNFGVSVNLMTIPGVEIRGNVPDTEPDGNVDAVNISASVSYASTFFGDWLAGITVKYLYEEYYLYSAPGWAMDVGVQKREILSGLDWGFTFRNIGRMSELKKEATSLPVIFRNGFAYKLPFKIIDRKPLLTADLEHILDESTYIRVGAEIDIKEYLSFRSGLMTGNNDTNLSAGIGVKYEKFRFDYAFVPYDYDLGNTHRFSFMMRF
ncbi:MAG: PorV/PorQ family protein [Calditrichaceae bacterium]